jgi:integrase
MALKLKKRPPERNKRKKGRWVREFDNWYAVGSIVKDGKRVRVRKSMDTSDYELAKFRMQQFERRETRAGVIGGYTLSEAIDSYLSMRNSTSKTTSQYLERFRSMWGHMALSDFDQGLLDEYVERRQGIVAGATVRREMNALMPVFQHAYRKRWLAQPFDVEKPKEGKPRRRVLSDEEVDLLLQRGKRPSAWRLAVFMLNTGARIGEAVELTWDNVHMDSEPPYLVLKTRKTRGGEVSVRSVPINKTLLKHLRAMASFGVATGDRVFPGWGNSSKAVKALQRHAKQVGVVDFTTHDLRRTFATRLLEAGASPRVVAEILGHTSLAMVMRYTRPSSRHVAKAVQEMDDAKSKSETCREDQVGR